MIPTWSYGLGYERIRLMAGGDELWFLLAVRCRIGVRVRVTAEVEVGEG